MKKFIALIVVLILAFLGWMFFTGQDDPEIKSITDDVTDVAKRISDKAKGEAEAIRKRVMKKNNVELHSDAKPMTVESPAVSDIKFHVWGNGKVAPYIKTYTTETAFSQPDPTTFMMDDSLVYMFSLKRGGIYKIYKSCSDLTTEDKNGMVYTSKMMTGCWAPIKIENDALIMRYVGGLVRMERITGEQAKKYQVEFDAWKSKH